MVEKGDMIPLLGPIGAGKSSLLTALAGLLPVEGAIDFSGRPLQHWSGYALARYRAWLAQQQYAGLVLSENAPNCNKK